MRPDEPEDEQAPNDVGTIPSFMLHRDGTDLLGETIYFTIEPETLKNWIGHGLIAEFARAPMDQDVLYTMKAWVSMVLNHLVYQGLLYKLDGRWIYEPKGDVIGMNVKRFLDRFSPKGAA